MTTRTATALPLARRIGSHLSSWLQPVKRHSAIAELAQLDDRLLRDIGLSRIDVDAMRRMW